MSKSVISKGSNASSKMLEEIANRSQTKIHRVEGSFSDEEMRVIWNALGLYISRNLRMGRGVNVPRLGIFTFTPPQVRLKGVTNEEERDQQPRTPVFLIQKDFVKGLNLRTAIFYHQEFGAGLRPYSGLGTTGEVPIAKLNLIEVSSYANMSKDATELGLHRIFKYIAQKLLAGGNINLQIPNLGAFICRNHLVAVKFNEYIQRDTRNILAKSVDQRKLKGNMSLTSDNLKRLSNISQMSHKLAGKTQDFFEIDDHTRNYLEKNFDLHIDDSNLKRSVTNFDRTIASKAFNKTNQSLKQSHSYRLSQSGFFGNRYNSSSKEFNMALKLVREWVKENDYNSEQAFEALCNLIGKKSQVLNQNQLWNATKQISVDITQQQAQQLFRILDHNKDGLITIDDWRSSIQFNQNNPKYRQFLQYLKQKKYNLSKILSILGLEGVRKVSIYTLKAGLLKLWPSLSDDNSLLLAKYISRGKDEVQVQQIIDALNIKDEGNVPDVDEEWESRFFGRLKRKVHQSGLSQEELANRFRLYDQSDSGYIDQTDFKTILGELGVSISLNQLIKLVKFVPLSGNKMKYQYVIDRITSQDQVKEQLTEQEFKKVFRENYLEKFPYGLPITVIKLTSILQAKFFKKVSDKQVLQFVRKIDLNEDQNINDDDLKGYRQLIKGKTYKQLNSIQIEQLLIRLREKSIKKKISFYDLFRKIDKVGSGFISRQSWLKNIDEIISFSKDEKQNLFNYMDKTNSKMIDYKTFLAIMNGHTNIAQSENFNWVSDAIQKLKQWFRSSHLTIQDAFKVIDKDGDTYVSEKDLHDFFIEKLKYQQRELSMVRTQKFIKIMDYYKHGRVTFLDWFKFINQNKDWHKQAKKQIGIVLSKLYPSLSEAFTSITQGDKRLVFASFERWVRSNHVLSGFMINEDMLKTIFASLDQHKKGYLLQNDFIGLFGGYDWKSEHLKEFTDYISLKFKSSEEAFRFLSGFSSKSLDFTRFKEVIHELFGNRFHSSDVEKIWSNISGGKGKLELAQFKKLHGNHWSAQESDINSQFPKDSWRYQDFSIIKGTTIRSNEHEYQERDKMEQQCITFINNLKQIIASSPKTLEQAFSEVDKQKSGKITNLMFKKAFRNLNIALTSKQIDLLINYCQFKPQTLIDWRRFIKMLDLEEDKQRIRVRLQPKLQHLSDLLHYYMISPKDAFRKWNNPRSGYLNFQEFHKMLKELYSNASESLPQFQVLQDIFEFIDIRKDGHLDFQQFTQVFRNCNPPNFLMGTTPAPSNALTVSRSGQGSNASVPIRERSIPKFRHSPEYEKFIHLIGRNRKYIQEEIEKSNQQKLAFISFITVQGILTAFCKKHGLKVDAEMIRNLIAFSMTGQNVDYHLLVSKFKDLSIQISEFPKRNIF